MKQSAQTLEKGAVSSRLTQVVSPVAPSYIHATHHKTGTSTNIKENTDSDFFNLTAEDESQMDPILVMRNLSNTNLGSGTTSMMQIQESSDNMNGNLGTLPSGRSLTNHKRNNYISTDGKQSAGDIGTSA